MESQQLHERAARLAKAIISSCGDASTWPVRPDYGYPASLAMCVVDSIQSTGIKYGIVEGVIARYRQYRGDDAETDGAPQLLATFTALGGVQQWADEIGTDNRLYPRMTAPLKADAIKAAAAMLIHAGVHTAADFRDHATDGELRSAWTSLPSQRSAITWHYAHMLAGTDGVKPDRMIRRFTSKALRVSQGSLTDQDLIDLSKRQPRRLGSLRPLSTTSCGFANRAGWAPSSKATARASDVLTASGCAVRRYQSHEDVAYGRAHCEREAT